MYLTLLRRPVVAVVWLGQLTSVIGDRLYGMTLLWLVLQSTGSTWAVATVAAAETASLLAVALLGGRLIRANQRWSRLAAIDLTRVAVALTVPLAWPMGEVPLAPVALVAALLATLDAIHAPGLQAITTGLARDGAEVRGLLGLLDSTDRVARIVGPGSAGVLLTVLPAVGLFVVNASTFAISAICLYVANRWHSTSPTPTPACATSTARWAGLAALRRDQKTAVATLLRVACNLLWAAFTLGLPVLLVDHLDQGLGSYGLLLAAFGVGNLIGNLMVGNLNVGRRLMSTYCCAWAAVGIGFLAMALALNLTTLLLACAWAGIFTPLANVTMDTYLATHLPREELAPTLGFQKAIVRTAGLISTALVGLLLTLGTTATFTITGTWMILAAATAYTAISNAPTTPRTADER